MARSPRSDVDPGLHQGWRRTPSGCKRYDGTWLAGLGRGRVRLADEKAVGARKLAEHGAILHRRRSRHRDAVRSGCESGPEVISALVVRREITAEARRIDRCRDV